MKKNPYIKARIVQQGLIKCDGHFKRPQYSSNKRQLAYDWTNRFFTFLWLLHGLVAVLLLVLAVRNLTKKLETIKLKNNRASQ